MSIFTVVYWLGLAVEVAIRVPVHRARRQTQTVDRWTSRTEVALLNLLSAAMFFLPLVYSLTPWLDFADYRLPVPAGWAGVVLLAGAVWLFWLSHRDLSTNWSPTLEIHPGHQLVTSGIYRCIRHPMYASQWLWVLAQPLLLWNWIAGPANLLLFIPFYLLRVRAEEQMMLEHFGEQYRRYMQETGAIFPKL